MVAETVSGSEAIARRREFGRLLDRLEAGDMLVVTRLDRLGRDAIDVAGTVTRPEGTQDNSIRRVKAGYRIACP